MTDYNSKPLILVVEDDAAFRTLLVEELEESGYRVSTAGDLHRAREGVAQVRPDLVISDLRLPDGNGIELLEVLRQSPLPPAFLLITAFGTIPQAVEALQAGADHFLTKPLDFDHLLIAVEKALEVQRLKREVADYRKRGERDGFHGMSGDSRPMRDLFVQIKRIARAADAVLITGESGVGKELVAHAVHAESPRVDGPFIPVNCAGMPAELLESEFFGHTEGAFTGARRAKKGLFVEADGGTLFLDEIGELPMALQAKLLRVLQDGAVRPLGANREKTVDVRVIAATNRELEEDVRDGRFREDLYYRLEAFTIRVPRLRDRAGDIEAVAVRILTDCCRKLGKQIKGFSAEALQCIHNYEYPGNVRELQNIVKRAVVFCEGDCIEIRHLPQRMRRTPAANDTAASTPDLPANLFDGPLLPTLEQVRLRYVRHVLEHTGGNKRRAAAILGIGRRTLYDLLRKGKD